MPGKRFENDAAKVRQQRIEKVARRLAPAVRDQVMQFSLSQPLSLVDGAIKDPMETMLEVLEKGLLDVPSMLMKGAAFSEVKHPEIDGEVTAERADQIARGMMGRAGEGK